MALWRIDPDHSVAAFGIRHMTIANVRGQFNDITGEILFDPDAPRNTRVEARIALSGLTTGNRKRDEHLFSPDFFDAAKYPDMIFKSTGFEEALGTKGRLTGELTIHGVTRPISLETEYYGPVQSPPDLGGETSMGFHATTVIKREDFGITWNVPLGHEGFMVGKEVRIELDIEADFVE